MIDAKKLYFGGCGNIKFDVPKKQSSNYGINLLYSKSKSIFSYIPNDLTITTRNGSYKFNINMILNTSDVINKYFRQQKDLYKLEYNSNIEDGLNVMGKIEQLYRGNQISFSVYEILIVQKIVLTLGLKCFPDYIINLKPNKNDDFDKYVLVIDEESLLNFLQNLPKEFNIKTCEGNYFDQTVNIYGVRSSNIIRKLLEINEQLDCYESNLTRKQLSFDFNIIRDYFDFQTIRLTASNYQSVKKIAAILEITDLCEDIDIYVNNYMIAIQAINDQQIMINSISELFEYLYNRNGLRIETIKDFLENSIWAHSEDNIIEFSSCFIQVIYADISLHQFLIDLLLLLDENSKGKNDFNLLIPFLSKTLLNDIGINKLNCAFIYRLYSKGKISKSDLFNTIKRNFEKLPKIPKDQLNNFIIWFFPEIFETKCIFDLHNFLDDDHKLLFQSYYPNNVEQFKKMRENFEPDDEITKALMKDDVDKLQSIMEDSSFKQETVPFNIFESFVENGKTKFLNYSAAYGSAKCFKYLKEQSEKKNLQTSSTSSTVFPTFGYFGIPSIIDNFTKSYAIYGQNKDIIDILKPSFVQFYYYNSKEIFPVIIKHLNDNFNDYMNYISKITPRNLKIESLYQFVFQNIYFHPLIKLIFNGFDILSLADQDLSKLIELSTKSGCYNLTKLLFQIICKNKDYQYINKLIQGDKIKDSVFFGNLSIFKLYESSLSLKSFNFKDILSESIIREHLNIIEYIFEKSFSRKCDLSSSDALHLIKLSIQNKKADICKYLFGQLVDKRQIIKNFPDRYNESLIISSCESGNIECVKFFIEMIFKKNKYFDCTNSIIKAIANGNNEICQYLIQKKFAFHFCSATSLEGFAMIDRQTFSLLFNENDEMKELFENFLYMAIRKCNSNFVEYLLENNVPHSNALIEATLYNNIELVKIILKHDSSPTFINSINPNGNALNIAIHLNNEEITKLLLSIPGIDPNLYSVNGQTPLIAAFTEYKINMINLLMNFYGDSISTQQWQLNEILRIFLTRISEDLEKKDQQTSKTFTFLEKPKQDPSSKTEHQYPIPNQDIIKKLLEIKDIDINYCINNLNLLIYACESNLIEIASILIKNEKCDVNIYSTKDGNSPLIIAISKNNLEIAELLIRSPRININHKNFSLQTAFMIASKNNLYQIIELILNSKSFNPKENSIEHAFALSNIEISKRIIAIKEFNVNNIIQLSDYYYYYNNKKLIRNCTLLSLVIGLNNNEKVEMILRHSSFDPAKSNIKEAIFTTKNILIFEKLMQYINNDVNIHFKGESLLVAASKNHCIEIIQKIINNPNFDPVKSEINIAFMKIMTAITCTIDNIDIIDKMYEIEQKSTHLIDFNKILPNNKTYFTSIPDSSKINLAAWLIDHGADPDMPDGFGIYPLQYAIEHRHEFCKTLISCGKVDLTRRFDFVGMKYKYYNITYLHFAAASGNSKLLSQILDCNAIDVNAKDKDGNTPLMLAAIHRYIEIIKILFERDDIDYMHCNNDKKSALDLINKGDFNSYDQPETKEAFWEMLLTFYNKDPYGSPFLM